MEPVVRRAVIALAIAGTTLTGAFAIAQGTPPPQRPADQAMRQRRGPGGPGGGMMMSRRLNLTDEQRAQMQKLRQSNFEAHQAAMQRMHEAQKELRDAIFADNGPDEARIAAAQAKIQALHPEMEANRISMQKEMARILTPEQRKQMREMPAAGRGGRPGMRGMGRGMGRGIMGPGGF